MKKIINSKKGGISMEAMLKLNSCDLNMFRETSKLYDTESLKKQLGNLYKIKNDICKSESYKKLVATYLSTDKKVRSGETVVSGTRITIKEIYEWCMVERLNVEEILAEYPGLTEEQIAVACTEVVRRKLNTLKVKICLFVLRKML